MKFRLIEKTLEAVEITEDTTSEWLDVGGVGGDSIALVMTATGADTPGTASIALEASLDKSSVVAVGSPVSVTDNGVFSLEKDRPTYRYYRVKYAISSGSYTSSLSVLVKGDRD